MKPGWITWMMALSMLTSSASAALAIPCTCCCVDKTATTWDQGHILALSGPLQCPKGQVIEMRVKVTQTGHKIGEGYESAICTGEKTHWTGLVKSWSFAFTPGQAHAHAWATTYSQSKPVKSWDWQGDINIH